MLRQKKQYQEPAHPWQGERIKEEAELVRSYGLRNKKEVWRAQSKLRNLREQARRLVSLPATERKDAQKPLFARLVNIGLLNEKSGIDDILSLTIHNILGTRLQTTVHKQNLSATTKQARQYIVHKKVMVNGTIVTSPAYEVKGKDKIAFVPGFVPAKVTTKQEAAPAKEAGDKEPDLSVEDVMEDIKA